MGEGMLHSSKLPSASLERAWLTGTEPQVPQGVKILYFIVFIGVFTYRLRKR
jgi:hypothetical protein